MTPKEAFEILEEVKQLDDTLYAYSVTYMEALEVALSVLKEIQNYRKLGTLEELARAKKYIGLSKRHSTIGEMIDECAAYEEIGTVEECREAVEKQKAKKPILINYKEYANKIANAEFLEDAYFCPNCKTVMRSGIYCKRCGQAIQWNENLEEIEDERD